MEKNSIPIKPIIERGSQELVPLARDTESFEESPTSILSALSALIGQVPGLQIVLTRLRIRTAKTSGLSTR